MIAHVVLFNLRPGLTADARDGLAEAFSLAAREIPAVRHARIGARVLVGRPYEQVMAVDYRFSAILEFDDLTGLKAYLDHPVHELLAGRFFACIDQALTYDFEFWETEAGIAALRRATEA
jgi:hypothetical protein